MGAPAERPAERVAEDVGAGARLGAGRRARTRARTDGEGASTGAADTGRERPCRHAARRSGGLAAGAMALAAGPALAQVQWDLSTIWPEENFHTINANRFADEVREATDGAVDIAVKSGGQLGFKGPEHLRAVRDGLVPMADVLNIQQVGDEPVLGTEGIPFLVSSAEELRALHEHPAPRLRGGGGAQRPEDPLHGALAHAVPAHERGSPPPTSPRFREPRCARPTRTRADMLDAVGMTGVLMPWGEVVPALASGAVAGVSTSARLGRRRQVLGVPRRHLPHQPRLVLTDGDGQPRRLERALPRGASDGGGDRGKARAGVLGDLGRRRRREPGAARGGWHDGWSRSPSR